MFYNRSQQASVWKTRFVFEILTQSSPSRPSLLHTLHPLLVAVLAIPANSSAQTNYAKSAKHIVDYFSHVFFLTCIFIITKDCSVWMSFVRRNTAVYYLPTDYNLVLFSSLHYYRSSLIVLTRNSDVVIVYNVSRTSPSNTRPVQLLYDATVLAMILHLSSEFLFTDRPH